MRRILALSSVLFLTFSAVTDASAASKAAAKHAASSPASMPAPSSIKLLRGKHLVTLKTSKGDIRLELDADKAPKTVTNFITLAARGYYDNLTFHRVIPDFMIQGGDPNGNGTGGKSIYGETFEDEINTLTLTKGVIAMANRGPNTNGSQFFIVAAAATPWLDGHHTTFGRIPSGDAKSLAVLDAIVGVPRDGNDMPLQPVTFTVTVEKAKAPAAKKPAAKKKAK